MAPEPPYRISPLSRFRFGWCRSRRVIFPAIYGFIPALAAANVPLLLKGLYAGIPILSDMH